MAPKRKSNTKGNKVSKTTYKRRANKQRGNFLSSDESVISTTEVTKNKHTKNKIKKSKSISKRTDETNQSNETNDALVIETNSVGENTNSMSVESTGSRYFNNATSSSMNHSSASLDNDTQLKPSTHHSISMDDDDDEFRQMFMTTTPRLNNRNYNSTPLNVSSKNDKNNQSVGTSLSTRCAKDATLSQLSNTTNNHLNGPILNSRNINTSINSCVHDVAPQSQSSTSVRSLPSITFRANNSAVLETFGEYRNLKRDYERAKKQNEIWSKDYQTLTNRMRRLEQTTFPRPTADGYAFLEQLLESLRNGRRDEDSRTNADLARDFGITEAALMSLSNTDPQKTALRVFNTIFPTYEEKETLINVAHLTALYPNVLINILAFARRCSPGCGYNITMLKEAIGNSIRCARHQMKRNSVQHVVAAAAAVNQPLMHPDVNIV